MDSRLQLSKVMKCIATIAVSLSKIWLQLNRLVITIYCFLQPSKVTKCIATVTISLSKIWLQLNSPVIAIYCLS